MDNPYSCEYEKAKNKINKTKCLSLTINILVSIGCLLGILDNDLLRDIINRDYKYQPSNYISGINAVYNFVLFIISNILYYTINTLHNEIL